VFAPRQLALLSLADSTHEETVVNAALPWQQPPPRRLPVTRPPAGLCLQGGPAGLLPAGRVGLWRAGAAGEGSR